MEDLKIINLKKINKSFPGVKAVNNVNFSLKKGEVHSIVGENGAGKSTLVNIIIGIVKQDSGDIIINGETQQHYSPFIAKSLGIRIVPQELVLLPNRSVAENIFFGEIKSDFSFPFISWSKIYKEAKESLLKIGLDIDVREKVSNFNVAYQQLFQITRAIVSGTQILILDEPTASLTVQEVGRLFGLITSLKKEGKSIIFISHILEEVKLISDRVSVMRDGNLECTVNTKDVDVNELIKIMVGREIVNEKLSNDKIIKDKVALEVKNLTRKDEFNNINFSMNEGEILGITGLIGSGRTELAKCIFGETLPNSGEILLFGKKVKINNPSDAIKLGIGYVPEDRRNEGLFPLITVTENLLMPLLQSLVRFIGINHYKKNKIANKLVEELQIKTPSLNKQVLFLSGGNQQKVVLARWLAKNTKLLILDEPTRGIDVNAKSEIHKLIKSLANKGLSVIVISSEIEEIIDVSDRIIVMNNGKIKGFLKSEDAKKEAILKLAF